MFIRLFILLSIVAFVCIGCGGGGGGSKGITTQTASETINLTTSPTFDDGAHYVQFLLQGIRTGDATLKVTSTGLDPFMAVEKLNVDGTSEVIACDDDSGVNHGSTLAVSIASGTTYRILVSSAGPDAGGTVTLEYPSNMFIMN